MFGPKSCKQIWIHGDNLLMVPHFVKRAYLESNIGFFFHSPFPSYALFRMFMFRNEILSSLLQCDVVGFHLFESARNFILTCHRLLWLQYEFSRGGYLCVNFHGKNIMIRVSHIGIDDSYFQELFRSRTFKKLHRAYQSQFASMRSQFSADHEPIVISSIDSIHPMSGVKNKLLAYQ